MTIESIVAEATTQIEGSYAARERALASSRALTRQCANTIRAVHRGEFGEAEALLREAIRYDASAAKAHYQLGMLLEQQDHLNEAVAALKHAAASDRDYAEPHYALARIYRRQGKTDAATEAMATFQRLHDVKRTGSGGGTEPGGAQAPPPQSTGTTPPR